MESEEEEGASSGGADGGVGGGLGRSASVDPNWVLARPNSSSRMMATILSWFSSLFHLENEGWVEIHNRFARNFDLNLFI